MKIKEYTLSIILVILTSGHVCGQNPIIRDQYTADPTARVFNGRIYLYPSHDIESPVEPERKWFSMADYHVFSSDNMTSWTDHGVILSQDMVRWVKPGSYSMWAPDCVKKDSTYYFYFPSVPNDTTHRGFAVGVAMARAPEGPFFPMWRPIKGINGIDPCVLIDPKDGRPYIYWAGMGMWMARLKDNMMELASAPQKVEGLPEGFKEGPFVFERQGLYYYTFPWVRDSTETLAYAMGDSPMGPFKFKGIIMEESPTACWTNHHSIVEYKNQWYLFYHHNDYSPDFDKLRSVRCDSLFFNPDGTIRPVVPTLRGVGITPAHSHIQIDRYSSLQGGASINFVDSMKPFQGWQTILHKRDDAVRYNTVGFSDKPVREVSVRAKAPVASRVEILAGNDVIARIDIPKSTCWTTVHAKVDNRMISSSSHMTEKSKVMQEGLSGNAAPDTSRIYDISVRLSHGRDVAIDYIGFDMMPWTEGGMTTDTYRNLFAEMGYSQKQIDEKLQTTFDALFYGPDKVYFEVSDSMAYISDLKNHDVRTEGMSYGMMIAVQWDKKDIFDRLWRWAKRYMQHKDGQRRGYFRWSCKTDGTPNAEGAASDGELYFVTSLIFASNRWGNGTGINYLSEAQNILNCSMEKIGMSEASPLVDINNHLITFTPDPIGGRFTDPSYHIPAFYEIWARYADDGRERFWMECAESAREYLHRSVNPKTGLTPDYNNFDGTLLHNNSVIGDAFRFDSWRVPMNIALDYSWSCADREWQQRYADTIQAFLYSEGIDTFVDQYNIDGTPPETILPAGGYTALRHSVGLVATAAAVSIAATDIRGREFVRRLWDSRHIPYADGYFDAYYDGLLRLFAMMHLSGRYRIIKPSAETKEPAD